jgi:septal ring-binding cell division protein DamX
MKTSSHLTLALSALIVASVACGPSPEEMRQKELARQDSLKRIQEQAAAAAKVETTETPSAAPAATNPAPVATQPAAAPTSKADDFVQFDANGKLTLQVEAWRNRKSAEKSVDKWKKRGIDNAYAVLLENPETGEIWYRVRIGKFKSKKWALKQQQLLKEQYQVESWLDNAESEVRIY